MIKKIAFTVYPVIDMERARSFYETKLNLKPGKVYGEGTWVEYDLPQGGCFAITTIQGSNPSSDMGGSVAFEVENLIKLVSDLKSQNVEIKMDVFDSPACQMSVILDSEGNAVILHQLTLH